jgi:nucleoside 2-deoxyribosyltransferase
VFKPIVHTSEGRQAFMANKEPHPQASTKSINNHSESYLVHLAGGLFTQHELATNVYLKEAIWRLSKKRFELVLPQSKELRHLDRSNLAAYIRNSDIRLVLQSDIIIACFDGQELDSGTVVEFMLAKMLGKPAVIIRTDSRHLNGEELDDPFNLMLRNWPRTLEVYNDSFADYSQMIAEARTTLLGTGQFEAILEVELAAIKQGIDAFADMVVKALNAVIEIDSPYPPDLREALYEAIRFTPGADFDQLLTDENLGELIQRLKKHHTL